MLTQTRKATRSPIVGETECVLIIGSQNANKDDRSLAREQIVTVQMLDDDGRAQAVPFFNNWGELGVSSIAWHPEQPNRWFITTGPDLKVLDLETGLLEEIQIPKTRGIHEMAFIDNVLWISNTYFDEIIAFDPDSRDVLQRIHLSPYRKSPELVDEDTVDADDITRVNKFHCNQIFSTYEGELFALVHHVTGEQLVKRIAQKLIKSQGNGGVLNVRTGETHRLALKAPHSVRKVNGQYWIFDSGHAQINVYDKQWQLVREIPTKGWGRGGDLSNELGLFYAGISAGRKRYTTRSAKLNPNMVQVFRTKDQDLVTEFELNNVEQINNIYVVSRELGERLMALRP